MNRTILAKNLRTHWLLIPLAIFIAIIVAVYFNLIFINRTPSLDIGLYVRDFGPIARNDKVAFCPPEAAVSYLHQWTDNNEDWFVWCPSGQAPFLKRVAAIGGDHVTLSEDGISVNGNPVLLGTKPLRWIRGSKLKGPNVIHRMPIFPRKTYIVPAGEVWVYTPEWYGLDSRYFGPVVPMTKITQTPLTSPVGTNIKVPEPIARLQQERGA